MQKSQNGLVHLNTWSTTSTTWFEARATCGATCIETENHEALSLKLDYATKINQHMLERQHLFILLLSATVPRKRLASAARESPRNTQSCNSKRSTVENLKSLFQNPQHTQGSSQPAFSEDHLNRHLVSKKLQSWPSEGKHMQFTMVRSRRDCESRVSPNSVLGIQAIVLILHFAVVDACIREGPLSSERSVLHYTLLSALSTFPGQRCSVSAME